MLPPRLRATLISAAGPSRHEDAGRHDMPVRWTNPARLWRVPQRRHAATADIGGFLRGAIRAAAQAADGNRWLRKVFSAAFPSRVASAIEAKEPSARSTGRDFPATQISHFQGLSPVTRRFTTTL